MVFMLSANDMFNIQESDAGKLNSQLTIYALPFSMITTFFVSYVFDLFGRRYTLFFSYVLTALIFLGTPYTSPNYWMLAIARCLVGVTMSAPTSHPLINDYVRRSSRGRAVALNGVGVVIGELFTMGILLNLTKSMSYYASFFICFLMILVFAFYLLFNVVDPDMNSIRKRIDYKSKIILNLKENNIDRNNDREL